MQSRIKMSIIVAAVMAATIAGTGVIYAQTTSSNNGSTFVQKLAQKLGIGEDKVKTAMDEIRTEEQAEHEKAYEARLSQAVANGELTEAQKQLILQKRAEMKSEMESNRDSMQGKTREEVMSAMDAKRTALETWAKENNIDLKWLMFGGGKGGPHGMRGGFGMRG